MDCSPPCSPVHVSLGRNAGVGCHFFLHGSSQLGIKPGPLALQADSLPSEPPWKPHTWTSHNTIKQLYINFFKNQINLWRIFTLGVLREITAVLSSVCHDIQWRESNPWEGFSWDQSSQGLWGSNAQHNVDIERSPEMAIKRNEKGQSWFLHRVKISNLYILDITLEVTSENIAKVRTPITADINVKLWVWLRIWGLGDAVWNSQWISNLE